MINLPKDYCSKLNIEQTQNAIKIIRDKFQKELGYQLNLERVSAPLFLPKDSGLNDDLSGKERKVEFDALSIENVSLQVVQSLAKWKRYALHKYAFKSGEGLYTNMNAIRRDELLDNLHSIYVDQWDWEKIIDSKQRTMDYLKDTVRTIYKVIKHIEHEVWYVYPNVVPHIPEQVTFIDSQELLDLYPDLSSKERENKITQKYGAVFITRIGHPLSNGHPHDLRAPDYDDWQLNGDLLIWFEPLQQALEISSMGIRVDAQSLKHQLTMSHTLNRSELPYHKAVLNNQYPLTIGGGIGQSRLCMLLLQKAHIGEVQSSIWDLETIETCKNANINLL